jgi:hypothetical protein
MWKQRLGSWKTAVKDKWPTVSAIVAILIVAGLWSFVDDLLHFKWRYVLANGTDTDKVIVDDAPHDCAFFAAPLGAKYCRYDRVVSVVRWSTSQAGNPLISYDDGKT